MSRFDRVLYLSDKQADFYLALGVPAERVVASTSYCEPVDHADDTGAIIQLESIRLRFGRIVVMSGFPSALYNFQIAIEAIKCMNSPDIALCIFIYGPGELRPFLYEAAEEHPFLFLFDAKNELFFNSFLRRCDLFLRLTDVESFGISVWDANYWGRSIVATDICRRPHRAKLVKTPLDAEEIAKKIMLVAP